MDASLEEVFCSECRSLSAAKPSAKALIGELRFCRWSRQFRPESFPAAEEAKPAGPLQAKW